jgi:uncharacterized protein (DUF1015 family)
MATIKSFCAVRPTRDKAHLVATRPYYTYKKHIMDAKLEENPFTFMHIINPEYGLSDKTAPNSSERFGKVRDKFNEFIEDGILQQDAEPALYVYKQTKKGREYLGVIAGASVAEYENDLIKKHEATLTSREEVFVNYLEITGFNAEPVLLSHQPSLALNHLLEKVCEARPEYEFSTTDYVKHELWIVTGELEQQIHQAFAAIPVSYIADGHHRSASSAILGQRYREKGCSPTHYSQFFLAFFMDETKLDILPFHRVAKDLNGLDADTFLEALRMNFYTRKIDYQEPKSPHELVMYIEDQWYSLVCKPEIVDDTHPVNQLDAQLLTDYILAPLLDIKDLKTSDRIKFISGEEGVQSVIDEVNNYTNAVGFILSPITMNQVKAVADAHLIMPPKSTWVEPKLRSGLTIYPIDHD